MLRRMDTQTLARTALVAPLPVLAVEPFTASAYFRTPDGRSSGEPAWIDAWSSPLQQALPGAFTWSDPMTVYVTYGKVFVLAFAAFLCAVVAVRRNDLAGGRLRWAWPVATTAYAVMGAGVVAEYWTPWHDEAFLFLALPGLLLLLVSSPFLGARLLQQGLGSRAGAWMVALTPVGVPLTTALTGHLGFAVLWLSVAWMLHARTLLQPAPARVPTYA